VIVSMIRNYPIPKVSLIIRVFVFGSRFPIFFLVLRLEGLLPVLSEVFCKLRKGSHGGVHSFSSPDSTPYAFFFFFPCIVATRLFFIRKVSV